MATAVSAVLAAAGGEAMADALGDNSRSGRRLRIAVRRWRAELDRPPGRVDEDRADLLEEQHQSGVIATDASTCELPAILFDTLFSHLTTRTVMLGQTCTANAFQPMIQELIALVIFMKAER